MDFKATIEQADGSQKVIVIEIQKAKLHTDIMRFRRYLGEQYADKENSIAAGTYLKGEKMSSTESITDFEYLFFEA
jgi:hypothetical protein